jgi:hypothetical protein
MVTCVKGNRHRLVVQQDAKTVTELVSTCSAHLADLSSLKDSRNGTFAAELREDVLNKGLALGNRYLFSQVLKRKREVIILAEESVSAGTDGPCQSGIRDVSEVHFSLPRLMFDAIEALHHALEALPHLACGCSAHTLASWPDAILSCS